MEVAWGRRVGKAWGCTCTIQASITPGCMRYCTYFLCAWVVFELSLVVICIVEIVLCISALSSRVDNGEVCRICRLRGIQYTVLAIATVL